MHRVFAVCPPLIPSLPFLAVDKTIRKTSADGKGARMGVGGSHTLLALQLFDPVKTNRPPTPGKVTANEGLGTLNECIRQGGGGGRGR